jgi:hypothetical protein
MPKFKVKSFPPVRVDDSLYDLTVKCALEADEVLSVYIRKAVKTRNKQYEQPTKEQFESKLTKPDSIPIGPNTMKAAEKLTRPAISELKQKVKEMEKPKQVQTLFKGTI